MTGFRNQHDLLVYLIALSDSDDAHVLRLGQTFSDHLRKDGRLDWQIADREHAELGAMLWALRHDGSIKFSDWAGDQGGSDAQYRRAYGSLTVDDVWKFEHITVTSHGRLAGQSPRPTVAINIANVDLVVLLDRMEAEIEALPLDEDVREEARSKLRLARDAVADVSRTAATEAISAALRHVLGLP